MANLLWLQCSLSPKLNGINLQYCFCAYEHRITEKTPSDNMETQEYLSIYMCVRVYAHTYIWDSDRYPQRRFNFSLSPPNRLWGISFYAQGMDSVHADGLLWSTHTGACAHSYRRSYLPRLKRQSCACSEELLWLMETDCVSQVQT